MRDDCLELLGDHVIFTFNDNQLRLLSGEDIFPSEFHDADEPSSLLIYLSLLFHSFVCQSLGIFILGLLLIILSFPLRKAE